MFILIDELRTPGITQRAASYVAEPKKLVALTFAIDRILLDMTRAASRLYQPERLRKMEMEKHCLLYATNKELMQGVLVDEYRRHGAWQYLTGLLVY